MPAAIAAQNRRRSSRPATGGRPGDDNGARPDRSERRFRMFIATSFVKVLRRPCESALHTAIAVVDEAAAADGPALVQGLLQRVQHKAGVRPSMGSVGDAYDNAMCESFFATLECELLARRRFTSQAEARMAVFSYIEGWYNPARRHSGIRYLSPIAYETQMLKETQTT